MSIPVILITGAANGLTQAIAKRFVQNHWCIIAMDVAKEGLHTLNAKVSLDASRVADLRSVDNCHTLIPKILAYTSRLNVLVDRVGVWHEGIVENFAENDFDQVLEVDLKAVFYMCQAAISYLKENHGNSVSIFSSSKHQIYHGAAAYCASKVALNMTSKALTGQAERTDQRRIVGGYRHSGTQLLGLGRALWSRQSGRLQACPVERLFTGQGIAFYPPGISRRAGLVSLRPAGRSNRRC